MFSKSRVLLERDFSPCPRSRKVVNRSCIGKCSNHYRLIMKVGRMKNHDVCIMYVLQPLSAVIYTCGCSMENLQSILKHPVAMNSVLLGTFSPPACSVINFRCSAHILFTNYFYALFVIFSRKPRFIEFLPWAFSRSTARKTNMGCTMESSQNIRKGARSGRSTRPEPQSDWDSFSCIACTPKDPKGVLPLPAKAMISHHVEPRLEEVVQEGNMLEALYSQ
jgi:hypothetical protein